MAIPLTAQRAPVDFYPPALLASKPKVAIKVRVPTLYERDSFSAALVRGGVQHYSPKQVRDLVRAGVQSQHPPEKYEEIVADLEELWQVSDEEKRVQMLQLDRLVELLDVPEGTDPPDQKTIEEELNKIVPDIVMDRSKRMNIMAIQQNIFSTYQPLQVAFAGMAEQDARRAWLQAEIYVTGWEGLEHTPEGNKKGGLQKHEVEYLRSQIGLPAWEELSEFITALHGLSGDEEKNLALLLASMSGQTGSTAKESKASSANGSSTAAPTSPTPARGSRKTTGSSSGSGTTSKTKRGK